MHWSKMNERFQEKQSSKGILRKRCSENEHQFYRQHPCRSTISIKLKSNFIEITLWRGCSENFLLLFRTSFPKNTSRGMLLEYLEGKLSLTM